MQPGYGQYEVDDLHNMQESSSVGTTSDGSAVATSRYAEADGYFSYDMKLDGEGDYVLEMFFLSEDLGKTISITVGSEEVFSGTVSELAELCGADTSADKFEADLSLSADVVAAAAYESAPGLCE